MSNLTHSLDVRRTSLLGRWYNHWRSLGGKAPKTENACHFVRVVLFWAPLKWFRKGRIKQIFPPWMVLLMAFEAFLTGYLLADPGTRKGDINIIVLVILYIFIFGVLAYTCIPRTAKKVFRWVTSPIWIVPYLLFRGGQWTFDEYEDQILSGLEWFMERQYTPLRVRPVMVVVVALLVGMAISDFTLFLALMIAAGLIVGLVGILVGVLLSIKWINNRLSGNKVATPIDDERLNVFVRAYNALDEMVRFFVAYIVTAKLGTRICPFIHFTE